MTFKWLKGHWCEGWEDLVTRSAGHYTLKELEREMKDLAGNHNYCFMCQMPFSATEASARREMLDLVEMARL